MQDINTENAITMWGSISYSNTSSEVSPVALGEMFLKYVSTSNEISIISKMLDIEIVAVTKTPFGKRSKFFKTHENHHFENLIISEAQSKFSSPNPNCVIQRVGDGRLVIEIPVFLNGECFAYILMGLFFTSNADAEQSSCTAPILSISQIEIACKEICNLGNKYMSWCYKYVRQDEHDGVKYDADMLFNYGSFYDYNLVADTFMLSKRTAEIFDWDYKNVFCYNDFVNVVVEGDRQRIAYFMRNTVLMGSDDYVFDTTIVRKSDGRHVDIEIAGTLIKDPSGNNIRTLGYITDITELKRTQAELKDEVDSKNRIIRIIGHDLKNPFNGIIGFSELLGINLEQGNYTEACEFADIIRRSAAEGYDLLTNLLDYSNSQTGRQKMEISEFDLYKTVDSIVKLSAAQSLKKGITLHNSIGKNTMLYSDEYKISTIIRNLTSNALKFCIKDGVVIIECANSGNDTIRIAVSNTGDPIPEPKLSRINKGLVVESSYGTAYEQGTSIGLNLCHSFLKALDSKLVATCNEGITTFSFEIKYRM
ncbi:MAG: PAS domain-containing sensor histidine kinase [Bacteroidales bacterium]|nr:PAS domain-containing sensor histidine kinase [Bacteroidales bacterium]